MAQARENLHLIQSVFLLFWLECMKINALADSYSGLVQTVVNENSFAKGALSKDLYWYPSGTLAFKGLHDVHDVSV